MYQIDLVPTLSALLSLPIPDTNLGVAIPHVLESLASFDYMIDSIVDNSKQLSRLLSQEQTKERGMVIAVSSYLSNLLYFPGLSCISRDPSVF